MSIIAATGNRLLTVQGLTAKTYSYDARGKLTSNGTAAFTWNASGGLYKAVCLGRAELFQHRQWSG